MLLSFRILPIHCPSPTHPVCLLVVLWVCFSVVLPKTVWSETTGMETSDIRGELFATQFTTLSSETAARIVKIPFQKWRTFKERAILVTFDCTVRYAKLTRAQAVLKAARGKVVVLGKLDRLNVTSKLELTTAQAEEAKAQADLAIISAEIKQCQIVAPFAGQVVTQEVQEHQYVKAGQTLLKIHNPSMLELRFNVPSHWLKHLQTGKKFLVRIHETSRSYPAKITGFGARIDAVNQVVKVSSEIIGLFPELKPGMSGQVTMTFRK